MDICGTVREGLLNLIKYIYKDYLEQKIYAYRYERRLL